MDFSGRCHPGLFPYSALVGSTPDTCLRQYMEVYGSDCTLRSLRSCSSFFGRRHSLRDAEAVFFGSVQQT